MSRDLRPVYTAPSEAAAKERFVEFSTKWGRQYPAITRLWENAWSEFVPFLDYPVELRKIVYTTNAIESINFQLRKITKNRGHFPDKDAAMKLLYLGLRNISSHRGGDSGTGTQGWKVALNTMSRLRGASHESEREA